MTRRHRQHARRVRDPKLLLNSCEMVGRDSVEPRRIGSSTEHRPTVQYRKQWDWFPNNMPIRQTAPFRILQMKAFFPSAQFHFPIELVKNSMRPRGKTGEMQITMIRRDSVRG